MTPSEKNKEFTKWVLSKFTNNPKAIIGVWSLLKERRHSPEISIGLKDMEEKGLIQFMYNSRDAFQLTDEGDKALRMGYDNFINEKLQKINAKERLDEIEAKTIPYNYRNAKLTYKMTWVNLALAVIAIIISILALYYESAKK